MATSDLHLTKDQELINLLTRLVREADRDHEQAGGGTRHWVRDCFLPAIKRNGYEIELKPLKK